MNRLYNIKMMNKHNYFHVIHVYFLETLKSVQQTPDKLNSSNDKLRILCSNTSSDLEHNIRSSFNNTPIISTVIETSFQDSVHYHGRGKTQIICEEFRGSNHYIIIILFSFQLLIRKYCLSLSILGNKITRY